MLAPCPFQVTSVNHVVAGGMETEAPGAWVAAPPDVLHFLTVSDSQDGFSSRIVYAQKALDGIEQALPHLVPGQTYE